MYNYYMKTYICPNYLKNDLINDLLSKSKTNYLENTRIVPFNVFINHKQENEEALLIESRKKISSIKNDLSIYKNMIDFPVFINQIVSFTKQLITYNIDTDTLPEKTKQQAELKTIIKAIYDLPFSESFLKDIKIDGNLEDIFLLDYFTNNSFEYSLKKKLLENNANLLSLNKPENISICVKAALNKREEVEAIAQEICKNNSAFNSVIVCSDPSTSIPLIRQVFKRYNIPVQDAKHSIKSKHSYSIINMVNLSLNNDFKSLYDFLYIYPLNRHTIKFINTFVFNASQLLDIDEMIKENSKDSFEIIKKDIDLIKDDISILLNTDSYKDKLLNSYNILKKYINTHEQTEVSALKKIKTIIENTYEIIETKEDLDMVLFMIENISINVENKIKDGVVITSLNKPVYSKEYSYIIGCTSKNFPGFTSLNGIFDEKYVSCIDYPKLEDRFNQYFSQLCWLESSGKNITFSYYTNDLAGKAQEGAYDLNKYIEKDSNGKLKFVPHWDIKYIDTLPTNQHILDNEISKDLFFKNNMLNGSISSFESFFGCPYKYFINYGLNIKEEKNNEIGQDTIGTIVHSIMQKLVSEYGKDYAKVVETNLDLLLNEEKEKLIKLFPKDIDLIHVLFIKIKDNIKSNLSYLEQMEIDTSFKPEYTEFKFENETFGNDKVNIKGFIDRIDIAYDNLRIVDYKSGNTPISIASIESGTSLQLLTYLIVASKLLNKKALGAFYYTFKNEPILVKDDNVDSAISSYMNSKRMYGYIFNNDITSLTSLDTYKTFYDNKTGNSKIILDFDLTKEKINEIYLYLYNSLSDGLIDALPCNEACVYCPYKSICRLKGEDEQNNSIVSLLKENVVDEVSE